MGVIREDRQEIKQNRLKKRRLERYKFGQTKLKEAKRRGGGGEREKEEEKKEREYEGGKGRLQLKPTSVLYAARYSLQLLPAVRQTGSTKRVSEKGERDKTGMIDLIPCLRDWLSHWRLVTKPPLQ